MPRVSTAWSAIIVLLLSGYGAFAAQGPESFMPSAAEARFLALANSERTMRGARTLVWDASLAEAGRQHSQEMASLGYFDHKSPIRGLESPADRWERFDTKTPESYTIGENLFYGSEADVTWGHKSLMASPEHRANILNPAFSRAGVGVYVAPDGEMWVTEMFVEYGRGATD